MMDVTEREYATILENCDPENRLVLGVTGDGVTKTEFLLSGKRGLLYVDPHIEPELLPKILSRFSEGGS